LIEHSTAQHLDPDLNAVERLVEQQHGSNDMKGRGAVEVP